MTYSKKNRKHYRVCEVCLYSGICVKRSTSLHSPQENRGRGGETEATSAPQSAPHKNNRDKDDLVHLQPPPLRATTAGPGAGPGTRTKKRPAQQQELFWPRPPTESHTYKCTHAGIGLPGVLRGRRMHPQRKNNKRGPLLPGAETGAPREGDAPA